MAIRVGSHRPLRATTTEQNMRLQFAGEKGRMMSNQVNAESTLARRILVVDDEPRLRRMAGRLLRRQGHEVCESGDVSEALALLARHTFDLVVTDVHMPDRSGLELVWLVAERHGAGVLVISGSTLTDPLPEGAGFLPKPFSGDEFLNMIFRILD